MKSHMLFSGKGRETVTCDLALYKSHECLYAALVEFDKEALKNDWVVGLKCATADEGLSLDDCPRMVPSDELPEIGNETNDRQLCYTSQECVLL